MLFKSCCYILALTKNYQRFCKNFLNIFLKQFFSIRNWGRKVYQNLKFIALLWFVRNISIKKTRQMQCQKINWEAKCNISISIAVGHRFYLKLQSEMFEEKKIGLLWFKAKLLKAKTTTNTFYGAKFLIKKQQKLQL